MEEFIKLNIEKNGNTKKILNIANLYSLTNKFYKFKIVIESIKYITECHNLLALVQLINVEAIIKKLLKDLVQLINLQNYSNKKVLN